MKSLIVTIAVLSTTLSAEAQIGVGAALPADICESVKKVDEALVFTKEAVIDSTTYMAGFRVGRRNATTSGIDMYYAIDKACFSGKKS